MILVLSCALIVAWGVLNWLLIPDRPREWSFGALPDVPSESIYSSAQPGASADANPPPQMPPLPEARPRNVAPGHSPSSAPAGPGQAPGGVR